MPFTRVRALTDLIECELKENILRFWLTHTIDPAGGGFVGWISQDNRVDPASPKAVVLNTRILWAFSAALRRFPEPVYRDIAYRAFDYLSVRFIDRESGGVYWLLDSMGRPLQDRKQVYAQAFAIYALTEFSEACSCPAALDIAWSIFEVLEKYAWDPVRRGCFEAFSREWRAVQDFRLSEKDANEKKSMNTHLHLLEAYSRLLKYLKAQEIRGGHPAGIGKLANARNATAPGHALHGKRLVEERLRELINLFLERIIDPSTFHEHLFFDEDWNVRSNVVSFGHDIECSWLLTEAAAVLGDPELECRAKGTAVRMAVRVLEEGVAADGSILYERFADGSIDSDRHWWPQAEGLVGFLNAFELTSEARFLEALLALWEYIQRRIINHRHGEWYWSVSADGAPHLDRQKVGPWKGPYHNGRACLELLRRIEVAGR